ncbi:hypothetical protein MANES_15G177580v8 [Manihot esculenta]|uniref:Uncharacterized protein n=1 Tax=Manihot esculenta TaxID=3983 RepID=A0ACB7GCD5_MANES|nr:hypothetical protein MANES_15G177580v8 [Manihot esculenta]
MPQHQYQSKARISRPQLSLPLPVCLQPACLSPRLCYCAAGIRRRSGITIMIDKYFTKLPKNSEPLN